MLKKEERTKDKLQEIYLRDVRVCVCVCFMISFQLINHEVWMKLLLMILRCRQ